MKFKPGEVVVLKSGGPRMVIEAEQSNGQFLCAFYHKGRGEVIKALLYPCTLNRSRK